jgi:hypothetical protein
MFDNRMELAKKKAFHLKAVKRGSKEEEACLP